MLSPFDTSRAIRRNEKCDSLPWPVFQTHGNQHRAKPFEKNAYYSDAGQGEPFCDSHLWNPVGGWGEPNRHARCPVERRSAIGHGIAEIHQQPNPERTQQGDSMPPFQLQSGV